MRAVVFTSKKQITCAYFRELQVFENFASINFRDGQNGKNLEEVNADKWSQYKKLTGNKAAPKN